MLNGGLTLPFGTPASLGGGCSPPHFWHLLPAKYKRHGTKNAHGKTLEYFNLELKKKLYFNIHKNHKNIDILKRYLFLLFRELFKISKIGKI